MGVRWAGSWIKIGRSDCETLEFRVRDMLRFAFLGILADRVIVGAAAHKSAALGRCRKQNERSYEVAEITGKPMSMARIRRVRIAIVSSQGR